LTVRMETAESMSLTVDNYKLMAVVISFYPRRTTRLLSLWHHRVTGINAWKDHRRNIDYDYDIKT
jgi:hypothetical protein